MDRASPIGKPDIRWPLAAMAVVIAMQLSMVFTRSVNWDEFHHYAIIKAAFDGADVPAWQSPFLILFGWTPRLDGTAIDHIRAIRLLTLPFELVIAGSIYLASRAFVDRATAIVTVLAYLGAGYVFTNMLVLRADPVATALGMSAIAILLRVPLRLISLSLAAALIALAFVSTVKSVFYLFPIAGALWLRWDTIAPWLCRLILVACSLAALTGAAILFMPPDTIASATVQGLQQLLVGSAQRMFGGGLFPMAGFLVSQLTRAPFLTAAFVGGLGLILHRCRGDRRQLALLLFAVPFATAIIYLNSFPYNFVFTIAPAMIVASLGIDWALRRYNPVIVTVALLANAVLLCALEHRAPARNQRLLEKAVHQMFPQPVAVLDNSGMIGDFPRAYPSYLSGWGMANYHAAGQPIIVQTLERVTAPVLLPNSPALESAMTGEKLEDAFLPDDVAVLRNNYIRHWGNVFVAGKHITPGANRITAHFAVPGPYTLEGATITVDGRELRPGETVELTRGAHDIQPNASNPSTLRWGDHLPVPGFDPPDGAMFTNY